MQDGIRLLKIAEDEDLIELEISVREGDFAFAVSVYTDRHAIEGWSWTLKKFTFPEYRLEFPLSFGAFGPDSANGAAKIALSFNDEGDILVHVRLQSGFETHVRQNVASEATLHFMSNAAMFHEFLAQLAGLRDGERRDACLGSSRSTGIKAVMSEE